jgi:GNAT superfamily N-acetyltransferase
MHFSESWLEDLTLRDGTIVRMRLLRPSDREELVEAFEQLSEESRYSRFLAAMPSLTRAQLDYLTQVDQVHHVAIAVAHLLPHGDEEGAALARYVELDGRPGVAEPALTVVDHMQRKGLGTELMIRLCQAAAERGVHTFYVEFLATNTAVLNLLREVSHDRLKLSRTGPVYSGEFPIPETEPGQVIPYAHWLKALIIAARHARAIHRSAASLKGPGFLHRDDGPTDLG